MRYILILIFIFSIQNLHGQQKKQAVNRDSITLSSVQTEVGLLKKQIDVTNSLISVGNNSVANQLSTTNLTIAIFGAILAVGVLGLGIYFNRIETRVKDIENRTQQKLEDIRNIESRIKDMQFNITNNLSQIYLDLQNTEIEYLLDKLKINHRLIVDFHGRLMSFDVNAKYFGRFYEIWEKLNAPVGTPMNYNKHSFLKMMWVFFWKQLLLMREEHLLLLPTEKRKDIVDFIINYSKTSTIPNVKHYVKTLIRGLDTYEVKGLCSFLDDAEINEIINTMIGQTAQIKATPELHASKVSLLRECLSSS